MERSFLVNKASFISSLMNREQALEWLKKNSSFPALVMTGRSNVGKSSLINSILGQGLSKTSKKPGKTRGINIYQFQYNKKTGYLYDLPGYGYAKVSKNIKKQWDYLIDSFFSSLSAQTIVVNIRDARHPSKQADHDFENYIEQFNLKIVLVFNKIDKINTQKDRAIFKEQKKIILENLTQMTKDFSVSARSQQGVNDLVPCLMNLAVGT